MNSKPGSRWIREGSEKVSHVRGRETVPVISLEGAIGVLLYGMVSGWYELLFLEVV